MILKINGKLCCEKKSKFCKRSKNFRLFVKNKNFTIAIASRRKVRLTKNPPLSGQRSWGDLVSAPKFCLKKYFDKDFQLLIESKLKEEKTTHLNVHMQTFPSIFPCIQHKNKNRNIDKFKEHLKKQNQRHYVEFVFHTDLQHFKLTKGRLGKPQKKVFFLLAGPLRGGGG